MFIISWQRAAVSVVLSLSDVTCAFAASVCVCAYACSLTYIAFPCSSFTLLMLSLICPLLWPCPCRTVFILAVPVPPPPGVNIEEHIQIRQEEKRQRINRRHRLEEGRGKMQSLFQAHPYRPLLFRRRTVWCLKRGVINLIIDMCLRPHLHSVISCLLSIRII